MKKTHKYNELGPDRCIESKCAKLIKTRFCVKEQKPRRCFECHVNHTVRNHDPEAFKHYRRQRKVVGLKEGGHGSNKV